MKHAYQRLTTLWTSQRFVKQPYFALQNGDNEAYVLLFEGHLRMFHVYFNPSPFLALPHHSPQECRKEKPHLHIDQDTDALQRLSQAHVVRQHRTQTILAKTCQPTEARQLIWSQVLRHCLANCPGRLPSTNPPVRSCKIIPTNQPK